MNHRMVAYEGVSFEKFMALLEQDEEVMTYQRDPGSIPVDRR